MAALGLSMAALTSPCCKSHHLCMFWHLLLVLLSPVSALCLRLLHDDRNREVLALRQQVLILQRRLAKPPRLSRSERLALLLTSSGMKKRQLLASLIVVKPATLVGWHRQIVRRHWTGGAEPIQLPVRSPNLNAHPERWIRTVQEECLDRIIILNERHLRGALREFGRYYNQRRPHRWLKLHVPDGPRVYSRAGRVARRQILGGLINEYYREAA